MNHTKISNFNLYRRYCLGGAITQVCTNTPGNSFFYWHESLFSAEVVIISVKSDLFLDRFFKTIVDAKYLSLESTLKAERDESYECYVKISIFVKGCNTIVIDQ